MKTYWLALVELSSQRSELRTGEPRGGIVWVIGAATTEEAFRSLVTEVRGFEGFVIHEWMELAELDPGYRCDAFNGDEVVAELEASGLALFVDEIQWYMADDD